MGKVAGYRQRLYRAVHAEAKKRGYDHDALHDLCQERFGARSMSLVTDQELLSIYFGWTGKGLKRLGKLPSRGELNTKGREMVAAEDLVTLDAEFAKRGLGAEGKQNFIRRQLGGRDVIRTRRDMVQVLAGIRAMNRREGL
jgi:hypothetical protein